MQFDREMSLWNYLCYKTLYLFAFIDTFQKTGQKNATQFQYWRASKGYVYSNVSSLKSNTTRYTLITLLQVNKFNYISRTKYTQPKFSFHIKL